MAKRKIKLSKKEAKYRKKLASRAPVSGRSIFPEKKKITVAVPSVVSIRNLAALAGTTPEKVIETLFLNGITATINESIDFETAVLIGDDLGIDVKAEKERQETKSGGAKKLPRPPVITVMGHVDHGKTKLLDAIRNTNIAEKEAGGITQHIGAYQVEIDYEGKKRKITFIDTPGHEAFSELRVHGANITDVVVLVVAANEGVKPQTKEAVSHAKSAGVPIVVALNKIDLPDADPDRVKQELSKLDLLAEEWGGKTPIVPISAKKNQNIDKLLEMVLLVADLSDLKAEYSGLASGTVLESHIESGLGAVATILIAKGTLKKGDFVVIGDTWGKVRILRDWRGQALASATPSTPVSIVGLKKIPKFGKIFCATSDDKTAKAQAQKGLEVTNVRSIKEKNKDTIVFPVLLKADVGGSLEAIENSLKNKIKDKVVIEMVSAGIGDVTESDINLSLASGALIAAFRVKVPKNVKKLAAQNKIEIVESKVIYDLIDSLKAKAEGVYEPKLIDKEVGSLEVLKVFFQVKDQATIGGKVVNGRLENNLKLKVYSKEELKGEGKIASIKVGPTAVETVESGTECGVGVIKNTTDDRWNIKAGDKLIVYRKVKI